MGTPQKRSDHTIFRKSPETLQGNPGQLYLPFKSFAAAVANHPSDASGHPSGGLMEILMREVTRTLTVAFVAAALSLAAAMPLVAAWRTPAEQPATPVSTDAPGQQIQDLPLVY